MPFEGDICTAIVIMAVIAGISSIVAVFMRCAGVPTGEAFSKATVWVTAIWIVGGVAVGLAAFAYFLLTGTGLRSLIAR
jgi:hypothetical protein